MDEWVSCYSFEAEEELRNNFQSFFYISKENKSWLEFWERSEAMDGLDKYIEVIEYKRRY